MKLNIYTNDKKIIADIFLTEPLEFNANNIKLDDYNDYKYLEDILIRKIKCEINITLDDGSELQKISLENIKIKNLTIEENNIHLILLYFFTKYIKEISNPKYILNTNTFSIRRYGTNEKVNKEELKKYYKNNNYIIAKDIQILENEENINYLNIITILENTVNIKKETK